MSDADRNLEIKVKQTGAAEAAMAQIVTVNLAATNIPCSLYRSPDLTNWTLWQTNFIPPATFTNLDTRQDWFRVTTNVP
jgi:hypothetical protein